VVMFTFSVSFFCVSPACFLSFFNLLEMNSSLKKSPFVCRSSMTVSNVSASFCLHSLKFCGWCVKHEC